MSLSSDIFSSATSIMDSQTTPKDFVSKWRTFQEAVQAARMNFEHTGSSTQDDDDLFSLRPQDLPANDSPISSSNNRNNKNNKVDDVDDDDDDHNDPDPDIDELDLSPRNNDRTANHKEPTTSGVSKISSSSMSVAVQKPREQMAPWELAYYHLVVDKSVQKIWAKPVSNIYI